MRSAIDLQILLVLSQFIPDPNLNAQDNSTDDAIRVESRGTLNSNRSGAFLRWKKSLLKLIFPEKGARSEFRVTMERASGSDPLLADRG